MKKVWKWIIGIVILLVVVAAIVGVVFLVRNNPNIFAFRFGAMPFRPGFSQPNLPNGGNVPNGPRGFVPGPNGQMPRGYGWYGPMMRGHGFSYFDRGFGPFGMFMPFGFGMFFLGSLFRLLVPLILFALVAIVFYELGKRAGSSQATPAPMPAASSPDPTPSPTRGRKVAKS